MTGQVFVDYSSVDSVDQLNVLCWVQKTHQTLRQYQCVPLESSLLGTHTMAGVGGCGEGWGGEAEQGTPGIKLGEGGSVNKVARQGLGG